MPRAGSSGLLGRSLIGLIALIAVVRFLRECGYGGVLTFFNVYLDTALRLPTASIGVAVSVSAIASIISTPLMPLLAKRWGTGGTSLAGLFAMAVAVLPIALSGAWLPATAGWAGMTAANSINEAAMQVYILGIVAPRWRALMSGAANMATTLGLAASASGGGYLIRAVGYRGLFLISSGLLLASAAAFAVHLGVSRSRETQAQSVPARNYDDPSRTDPDRLALDERGPLGRRPLPVRTVPHALRGGARALCPRQCESGLAGDRHRELQAHLRPGAPRPGGRLLLDLRPGHRRHRRLERLSGRDLFRRRDRYGREKSRLADLVRHRELTIPLLAVAGVSAPLVLQHSGFSVRACPRARRTSRHS